MIYELKSENLTGLGGPMGTEHTSTNWRKYYTTVDKAIRAAELDFSKDASKRTLMWVWNKDDRVRTEDMGYVMYHIRPIKVEE